MNMQEQVNIQRQNRLTFWTGRTCRH